MSTLSALEEFLHLCEGTEIADGSGHSLRPLSSSEVGSNTVVESPSGDDTG
ncbi:unnamed protein product, partial [Strongylus vulgaris]